MMTRSPVRISRLSSPATTSPVSSGGQVQWCCSKPSLGDEGGADERFELCDVGSSDGQDRHLVSVASVGPHVEVGADDFCSERFGIFAVMHAFVRGVGVDRLVNVPGA
jgi:hypothetical protein